MKHSLLAGAAASAFAHLLGRDVRPSAARAEDDDDHKEDAARAEESDDDEDDDDKKDSKKSKKAKADDDEECEDDDDMAKGRKAERARWAKVLKSPAAAGGRVAAACEMLANTGMSAKAVIATLNALPVGSSAPGLRERMSGVPKHDLGDDASSAAKPGLAAQIVAAAKKRRGEK